MATSWNELPDYAYVVESVVANPQFESTDIFLNDKEWRDAEARYQGKRKLNENYVEASTPPPAKKLKRMITCFIIF